MVHISWSLWLLLLSFGSPLATLTMNLPQLVTCTLEKDLQSLYVSFAMVSLEIPMDAMVFFALSCDVADNSGNSGNSC